MRRRRPRNVVGRVSDVVRSAPVFGSGFLAATQHDGTRSGDRRLWRLGAVQAGARTLLTAAGAALRRRVSADRAVLCAGD